MKKAKKRPSKKSLSKNPKLSISKRLDNIEKNQTKTLNILKKVLKEEKTTELDEEKELNMARAEMVEQGKLESDDEEELSELKRIGKLEKTIEKDIAEKLETDDEEELSELKRIGELEKTIEKDVAESPLKKITKRDITKGVIGAFFGVVGHFAFVEGVHVAEHFSLLRSIMLLVTAFIILVVFLYFTGFRKVDDDFVFKILPIRAIVIYISAIITIYFVLLIYGKIEFTTTFMTVLNTVSAISILAVIGAGSADLIGKQEGE